MIETLLRLELEIARHKVAVLELPTTKSITENIPEETICK